MKMVEKNIIVDIPELKQPINFSDFKKFSNAKRQLENMIAKNFNIGLCELFEKLGDCNNLTRDSYIDGYGDVITKRKYRWGVYKAQNIKEYSFYTTCERGEQVGELIVNVEFL